MFEQNVKKCFQQASQKNINKKTFYILTHKKHKREIIFENNNMHAIKFMGNKFNSFQKRIIFSLIKFNILQIFLKKIKLDSNVGQLVFVGGQIKVFDFRRKEVLSFPTQENENKLFIKSREYQEKMAKKGFAPKILKINKQIPFSIEEFFPSIEKDCFKIFKKLIEYYTKVKVKEESSKKFISVLAKKIKNEKIDLLLQEISKRNTTLLITQIHGDLAPEQVLKKNDEIIFTDWNPHYGLIIEDLVNFFREEVDLLKNKEFRRCLKLYPNKVQKNIRDYLILNEIVRISKNKNNLPLTKIRFKKLLSNSPLH